MKISDNYKHKTKAYIHCDFPVGHAKAQEIILADVSKHRFMPFFGYNILVEKVKKLKKEEYRSLKADSPDGIIFFNDLKFLIKKSKNGLLNLLPMQMLVFIQILHAFSKNIMKERFLKVV